MHKVSVLQMRRVGIGTMAEKKLTPEELAKEMAKGGVFVVGTFGGHELRHIDAGMGKDDKPYDAFDKHQAWVSCGMKYNPTIVAFGTPDDDNDAFDAALKGIASGTPVVIRCEPAGFRELHFLSLVSVG